MGLTKKQQEILFFIQEYSHQNGISPSFREIGAHFGFASLGTVFGHLKRLKNQGLLTSSPRTVRSLEVSKETEKGGIHIPIVGSIEAGHPLATYETLQEISLPPALLEGVYEGYLLEVKGRSLEEEAMQEGDFILIVPDRRPLPGQMVLFLINRHASMIKRFYPEPPYYRFESTNPDVAPLILRSDHVEIFGAVKGVFRRFSIQRL